MNQRYDFSDMPESADELLAVALKRDISNRLEQAMFDDAVIAEFLTTGTATVQFDVVIDRAIGQGQLTFEGARPENQPFAGVMGQPLVAAMVETIRRRVGGAAQPEREEAFSFEITVSPDDVLPLGA